MIMISAICKDICANNLNNNNMNLSPGDQDNHHQRGDSGCHERHLEEQIPNPQPVSYQTRPVQRPKLPPHITICPPDENDVMGSHFLEDDEIENDVFQSPTSITSSQSTSYSDEKHKVHSGRLYLICHTGNAYILSSPTRSPTASPTQTLATFFPFRATPPPCTQQWHSPSSSPTPPTSPKVSVFVRVYRCNTEHFAVITRDSLITSKPVYLNMRHSRVIPGDCLGRFIVAGQCDSGSTIEFEVPELSSLSQWLDAFQVNSPAVSPNRSIGGSSGSSGSVGASSSSSSTMPRSPVLPTLAETDEDD